MPSMKAILVKDGKAKTAEGLYHGEAERPIPKDHEILVKVNAFGLNRMDIMQRQGLYPLPPGVTDILGVEFSGVVEESGKSDKWKKGDEVFGLAFGGAYAEYIAVAERMVSRKPDKVSWVEAASIPENWLTAYQALFWIAELKAGQSVLIHAGASGVGLAAIQLAKTFGASTIIATAGTDDKTKFCIGHGATHAINYKTQEFDKEVLKITNNAGVNVVLDFVGQSYLQKNCSSLARDGRMVLLGAMSGTTLKDFDMGPVLFKRLRIQDEGEQKGTTLRSRTVDYQSELLQEFTAKALDKLFGKIGGGGGDDGKQEGLDLVIHKVYDWKDIREAHEEMEAARNIGKIVCHL